LIFRLGWGWWADRQLAAKQDEVRRRGDPVALADVSYPLLNDADNAWKFQIKAMMALNPAVDSPRSTNLEYDGPPYSAQWMSIAAASEAAHGQAFALARAARAHPKAQFRRDLVTAWPGYLGYLNSAKTLVNTLGDAAEYAHFTGDDDESVERFLDLLHLARSLRQDDFLMSQLVAIGTEALACCSIQNVAPELAGDGAHQGRKPR